MSTPDNPYLQHLPAHQRGVGPTSGSSPAPATAAKEPLFGFLARKVTAKQVTKAMVPIFLFIANDTADFMLEHCEQEHDTNPFTKQPHSSQYKKILEGRKKLPVFAQMVEFYKMVSDVLCLVDWWNWTLCGWGGLGNWCKCPGFRPHGFVCPLVPIVSSAFI